jgi:hypothetical protein
MNYAYIGVSESRVGATRLGRPDVGFN